MEIYNIDNYNISILGTDEEGLNIVVANTENKSIGAIITYIPCGDKRYDYRILLKHKINIATIDRLMDKFTEMVVK